MKRIYVVRHCKAEGQSSGSPLTEKGFKQAKTLATFLDDVNVERIISSPYTRAVQTIEPLAKRQNIDVDTNVLLKERVLSTEPLTDWSEKLKNSFEDPGLKFAGGESGEAASSRIVKVVEDIFNSELEHAIIVTHGNLMALLLNHFDKQFGFDEWITLSNPDVYLLKSDLNGVSFERVWHE